MNRKRHCTEVDMNFLPFICQELHIKNFEPKKAGIKNRKKAKIPTK